MQDLHDLIKEEVSSLKAEISELKEKLALEKPILSTQEAAEFLGISINTLYGYCSKRIIPFYKPGGSKVFFDREELIAWIKENKKPSQEEIEEEAMTYLQR